MKDFRSDVQKLLDEINKPVKAENETLYRVQVGAYLKRENAEAMRDLLVSDGYPAIIKVD